MKTIKLVPFLITILFSWSAIAQKICDFEENSYQTVDVYDQWSASPFNSGQLEKNIKVIPNTMKNDNDKTEHILAIQRSRYGSNVFGAKIQLNTPFELTPKQKYMHVLFNTPVKSRVMLIGLGKREDRKGQSDQVVQFSAISNNSIKANEWSDAVFTVKGTEGVIISSLVVVPHCESPHNLQQDFIAYVDEIELSNSLLPRFSDEKYPVNFDKDIVLERDDRHLDRINFSGDADGNLQVAVPTTENKLVYHNLTDEVGYAKLGEKLTPTMNFTGVWMHGYIYIDYNNNGKFDATIDETTGKPLEKSEIVSYSYYQGKNSVGATPPNANPGVNSPAFILPADMDYGIYRMRYKVDWDNIDAGGSIISNNHIRNNGGSIVDILLNVHKETSHVKIATRNGDVLKSDGSLFEESDIPFGEPIEIELKPESKFKQNGIVIQHGYLDKPEFVNENRQWKSDTIPASEFTNNRYTIPKEYIDGNLLITAEFAADDNTGLGDALEKMNIRVATSNNRLSVTTFEDKNIVINDLLGHIYFNGNIRGKKSFVLNRGIYFVNKVKVFVP